jgi:hypothetical protein
LSPFFRQARPCSHQFGNHLLSEILGLTGLAMVPQVGGTIGADIRPRYRVVHELPEGGTSGMARLLSPKERAAGPLNPGRSAIHLHIEVAVGR